MLEQVVQVGSHRRPVLPSVALLSPSHAGEFAIEVVDLIRTQVRAPVHLRSR